MNKKIFAALIHCGFDDVNEDDPKFLNTFLKEQGLTIVPIGREEATQEMFLTRLKGGALTVGEIKELLAEIDDSTLILITNKECGEDGLFPAYEPQICIYGGVSPSVILKGTWE